MSQEAPEVSLVPTLLRRCLRITMRDTGDWFDLDVPTDGTFSFSAYVQEILTSKYIMGPMFFIPYNDNIRHITVIEFRGQVLHSPVQREKMN